MAAKKKKKRKINPRVLKKLSLLSFFLINMNPKPLFTFSKRTSNPVLRKPNKGLLLFSP